jgi:hypothetical protein
MSKATLEEGKSQVEITISWRDRKLSMLRFWETGLANYIKRGGEVGVGGGDEVGDS